jgi:hypothetical protein
MSGLVGVLLVVGVRTSEAAALGIPIDGFFQQLQLWLTGMGLLIGMVGLTGWAVSRMENSYGHILSGGLGFFTTAGILGGGTTLLGLCGLVGGGVV